MNAYALTFILICGVQARRADRESSEYSLNVGTVLFSAKDLEKTRWTKAEVALLQSRKYFQRLIPSQNFVDPSKDYIDKLLRYFRDAYISIKKEATDPVLDSIMTTALSDAIGGYLKLWILPVTKFSFYGGSVSYDNAFKIFNFYNEVRKYLGTDGSSWRNPDEKILSSIAVSIPHVPHVTYTRSMDDTCEHFAYFENTAEGFTIPLPSVNWEDGTMFVPLKNQSFISLKSPKSYNTLLIYYNDAKTCLYSKNPNGSNEFDARFQNWLSQEVVPHLMDDSLYAALGSVLSLLNRTRAMCDSIIQTYGKHVTKINNKLCWLGLTVSMLSKKVVIIGIILLIEICWCIIALKHIFTRKNMKSRRSNSCCSNMMMYFKCSKHRDDYDSSSNGTNKNSKLSLRQYYTGNSCDVYGGIRPQSNHHNSAIQCPSVIQLKKSSIGAPTRSQINLNAQVSSSGLVTVIDETKFGSKIKYSSKINKEETSITSSFQKTSSSNSPESCIYHNTCNCKSSEKVSFADIKQADDTITLYKKSQRSIERAMFESQENTVHLRKTLSERPKHQTISDLISDVQAEIPCACVGCKEDSECPCLSCLKDSNSQYCKHSGENSCAACNVSEMISSTGKSELLTQTQTLLMCIDKQTETKVKSMQRERTIEMKKAEYVSNAKETRRPRHPYLEIKIDRPNAEIKVDISGIGNKYDDTSRKDRSSKIPQKAMKYADVNTSVADPRERTPFSKYKSDQAAVTFKPHHTTIPALKYKDEGTANVTTKYVKHASNIPKVKKHVTHSADIRKYQAEKVIRYPCSPPKEIEKPKSVKYQPEILAQEKVSTPRSPRHRRTVRVVSSPERRAERVAKTRCKTTSQTDRYECLPSPPTDNVVVETEPTTLSMDQYVQQSPVMKDALLSADNSLIPAVKSSAKSDRKKSKHDAVEGSSTKKKILRYKSLIPKLKRRTGTVDDSVVKAETTVKNSKLNVTL